MGTFCNVTKYENIVYAFNNILLNKAVTMEVLREIWSKTFRVVLACNLLEYCTINPYYELLLVVHNNYVVCTILF